MCRNLNWRESTRRPFWITWSAGNGFGSLNNINNSIFDASDHPSWIHNLHHVAFLCDWGIAHGWGGGGGGTTSEWFFVVTGTSWERRATDVHDRQQMSKVLGVKLTIIVLNTILCYPITFIISSTVILSMSNYWWGMDMLDLAVFSTVSVLLKLAVGTALWHNLCLLWVEYVFALFPKDLFSLQWGPSTNAEIWHHSPKYDLKDTNHMFEIPWMFNTWIDLVR